MSDCSDELKALIDRYSYDLMSKYANANNKTVFDDIDNTTTDEQSENNDLNDTGSLQVRVSTENQAIPISGAAVIVRRENTLIRTLITDENGLTTSIDLPTKDRRLTLSPGTIEPYTTYTIDIAADGYFSKRFENLPVYGGVTAIQNVSMIPLPEYGDNDRILTYPQSGTAL